MPAPVLALLQGTCNDLDALRAVFQGLEPRLLGQCIFAAFRVSFRIFREIFAVGRQRGLFDISTLELFLCECSTDDEDPRNRFENTFFTLRLYRLFSQQLSETQPHDRRSAKVGRAERAPCPRGAHPRRVAADAQRRGPLCRQHPPAVPAPLPPAAADHTPLCRAEARGAAALSHGAG